MSYSGYPPHQGPNAHPPYPPQPNTGLPYPVGSTPYPPQGNYNYGSPIPQAYPPQSYPQSGGSAYPPQQPYPQSGGSAYPPQQPYPQSGGSAYPPQQPYPPSGGSAYPPQQSYPAYPAYPNTYQTPSQYPPQQSYPQSQGSPYPSHPGNQGNVAQHVTPHYSAPNQGSATPKDNPTVIPGQPFNPREDAEVLRKAMKGFGTDEKAIIHLLVRRTNAQRSEIAQQFKTLYGKDLISDLKSELTGNFEKLVVALMTPLPQFYVKEIHDAISGLGTDETVLTEVMCTLNNGQIKYIRDLYRQTYYQDLESDLKGDTGGHFKRLMVALCAAGRDESNHTDPHAAAADAHAIFNAGEERFGTDESTFNMILCQRNHAQLRLIFDEYQRISGHDIEDAIKSEFSGDIEDGLLAVVRSIKNRPAFFAKCLNKSLKGIGTNDRDLIRLVVTRSEVDMGDIKKEYAAKYGESLAEAIRGDCSGDYKKCLLALIGDS